MPALDYVATNDVTMIIQDEDFGKLAIDVNLIQDIASFLGKDVTYCKQRLAEYTSREMGEAWRAANPMTPDAMRRFYASTDLYLWELPKWHASHLYEPYLTSIDAIKVNQPKVGRQRRALDYGAGIGTIAIKLAEAGYRVTLADVPGITFDFAKYRLRRRNIPFDAFDVAGDLPRISGEFDIITCFDVLEHIPHPDRVWISLEKHLRPDGVVALVASFDAQPDFAAYHLRENYLKWGRGRWNMFMAGRGFRYCGEFLFARRHPTVAAIARLQYLLWRSTSLYIQRIPLHV